MLPAGVSMRAISLVLLLATMSMPGARQSADCRDVKLIERVARIGGLSADKVKVMAQTRQEICGSSEVAETIQWKDGSTAKRKGRWQFPGSSVTAKDPDGRLQYPKVVTARSKEGRWAYPNVVVAMDPARNVRQLPSGADTNEDRLQKWACGRLVKKDCDAGRADVARTTGDEKELALIEFAWKADRTKQPPRHEQ